MEALITALRFLLCYTGLFLSLEVAWPAPGSYLLSTDYEIYHTNFFFCVCNLYSAGNLRHFFAHSVLERTTNPVPTIHTKFKSFIILAVLRRSV